MSLGSSSRRDFLKGSAGLLAAHWMVPAGLASARTLSRSRNERPVFGAIGVGGQGMGISSNARRFGDCVAVCDVDRNHADKARESFDGKPEIYEDYRKLLDRKDIEAVTIGVPDHWHTAVALAALRAGKDVYCEKPLTLTVQEGQMLVKAVAETGRVFQVGTQQRSDERFRTACELVRNGRLGKIRKITVTLPDSTLAHDKSFPSEPVPSGLNWDFWQGQAPAAEYAAPRCHYTFRWWYEYSGGVMTDWGAHHMDIAHWAMGVEQSGPLTIEGKGEIPKIPNCYNTPKFFTVDYTYPNDIALHVEIGDNGVLIEGDAGRIFVNRGKLTGKPVEELKDRPFTDSDQRLYVSDDHMGNFFDCIKSRKTPISDVGSQHRTVSACHLANISLRLGRKLSWNAKDEKFVGDEEANSMLSREQRSPYLVAGIS